jgi:hypothetical protein
VKPAAGGGRRWRTARPPGRLRGRPAAGPLGLWLLAAAAACGGPAGDGGDAGPGAAGAQESAVSGPLFIESAAATGLAFHHFNGATGRYYMAEVMGAGGALFDYDLDGDLDVYLVQGSMLGGEGYQEALFPHPGGPPEGGRLFRNLLAETGELRFEDVTEAAGLTATGYGMGAFAGDVDNDGDPDLYVTHLGPNRLWRNDGDGTFTDATAASGTDDRRWSTGASFVDYDLDGRLDLYVVNYVDFAPERNKECYAASSALDYCGPASYSPHPDRLLRNRGDGAFEDVSVAARIAVVSGPGLGVVAADFDRDSWPDLYVANDDTANFLWRNQGDGTFADEALLAGVAFNQAGEAEASMGVDAGDFDGDGDDDLFMTHIDDETNTLYLNDGRGVFEDRTAASGLGPPSRGMTGFGAAWFDADNDGRLDLLTVNGHVRIDPLQAAAGEPYPLLQSDQFFRNAGGGRFEEASAAAGPHFAERAVGRGAAFGDVDNDGDTDVLVTRNNGPVRLLINQTGGGNRWIGLRLVTAPGGRDAYGARVALRLADGRTLWRRARADGSYLVSNDPRVLAGLGAGGELTGITVHWPDGAVESWPGEAAPAGRYTVLVQGTGTTVEPTPGGAAGR